MRVTQRRRRTVQTAPSRFHHYLLSLRPQKAVAILMPVLITWWSRPPIQETSRPHRLMSCPASGSTTGSSPPTCMECLIWSPPLIATPSLFVSTLSLHCVTAVSSRKDLQRCYVPALQGRRLWAIPAGNTGSSRYCITVLYTPIIIPID